MLRPIGETISPVVREHLERMLTRMTLDLLKLPRPRVDGECPECYGDGHDALIWFNCAGDATLRTCPRCGGTGHINRTEAK